MIAGNISGDYIIVISLLVLFIIYIGIRLLINQNKKKKKVLSEPNALEPKKATKCHICMEYWIVDNCSRSGKEYFFRSSNDFGLGYVLLDKTKHIKIYQKKDFFGDTWVMLALFRNCSIVKTTFEEKEILM